MIILEFHLSTNSIFRRRHERLFTLYMSVSPVLERASSTFCLNAIVKEEAEFERDGFIGWAVGFKPNLYA